MSQARLVAGFAGVMLVVYGTMVDASSRWWVPTVAGVGLAMWWILGGRPR